MGAYLSTPVTEKEAFNGVGHGLRYGGCGMQGWRRTMEDAHVAETSIGGSGSSEPAQLFGVFDGHGGSEVAKFCQIHMANELAKVDAFHEGANDRALEDVFHRMDEMLRDGSYLQQVQNLRCKQADDDDGDEDGDGRFPHLLVCREVAGNWTDLWFVANLQNVPYFPMVPSPSPFLFRCLSSTRTRGQRVLRFGTKVGAETATVFLPPSCTLPRPVPLHFGPFGRLLQTCFTVSCLYCSGFTPLHLLIPSPPFSNFFFCLPFACSDPLDNPTLLLLSAAIIYHVCVCHTRCRIVHSTCLAVLMGVCSAALSGCLLLGGKNDALDMIKKMLALKKAISDGTNMPGDGSADGADDMDADDGNCVLPEHKIQAGCTAVVTLIRGGKLYVANAGDSRAVLCRGGQAVALSDDHKPAQDREKNRIEAAGGFLADIGGVCRVNGNLNLSRAIGDLKYKGNTDLQRHEQIITAQPDVRVETIGPDDQFLLLACDGVWDVMSNQEAVDFVSKRISKDVTLSDICSELVEACLAADPKETRGIGCDNMTALIVQLNV